MARTGSEVIRAEVRRAERALEGEKVDLMTGRFETVLALLSFKGFL